MSLREARGIGEKCAPVLQRLLISTNLCPESNGPENIMALATNGKIRRGGLLFLTRKLFSILPQFEAEIFPRILWVSPGCSCLTRHTEFSYALRLRASRVVAACIRDSYRETQGSHRTWKTWKNRARPGKPGKTGGWGAKTWKNIVKPGKKFDLTLKNTKNLNRKSI